MQAKSFSDMITFTRPGAATYVDAAGVIQAAAADVPRFDYTHGKRGLLLEGPATNLVTQSGDLDTWSALDGAAVAPGDAAPVAGQTWWLVSASAGSPARVYSNAVTMPSGATYTGSVFVDAGQSDSSDQSFALYVGGAGGLQGLVRLTVAGGVVSVSAPEDGGTVFAAIGAQARHIGNGIYRVWLTVQNVSGDPRTVVVGVWKFINDTASLAVWGAQLETGSFASSYIPTAGSAVTRPADKAQLAEPVVDLLRGGEVSLLLQAQLAAPVENGRLVALDDKWLMGQQGAAGTRLNAYNGANASIVNLPSGTTLDGFGAVVAIDSDGTRLAANGSAPAVHPDATKSSYGVTSAAYLGRHATSSSYFSPGWYYQFVVWPFRMTDADIQAKAVSHA